MFIRIRLIPITIVFVVFMLIFRIGSLWDDIGTSRSAQALTEPTSRLLNNRPTNLVGTLPNLSDTSAQQFTPLVQTADVGGSLTVESIIPSVFAQGQDDAADVPERFRQGISADQLPLRDDPSVRGLVPLNLVDGQTADDSLIDVNSLSVSEVRLLHTLADRRRRLDSRERALTERESVLVAAERRLLKQQEELESVRDQIRQNLSIYNEVQEEQIIQMRAVYSAMKPKRAADIFNELDLDVLINVLREMTPRKIAPIISEMSVDKARTVTLALADRSSYEIPE